ncbi:MAG: tyrosine-type recombinase/integrase [Planctomycetota bacterium]
MTRKTEPGFYPFLSFLFHTGCRKGEARAVKWEDVDWNVSRVLIRRSLSLGRLAPPKSGKARSVTLSPALAAILRDLLAERRRECLKCGWGSRRRSATRTRS